jgi:hypothetical protein
MDKWYLHRPPSVDNEDRVSRWQAQEHGAKNPSQTVSLPVASISHV